MAIKKEVLVGIFFFAIMLSPAPSGLTETAWLVAAVAVLMVTWWATEAIPIPVTSYCLLPYSQF